MIYDFPPEWYYIYDESTDDCLGEVLAISEESALRIAAIEHPNHAGNMYAIAHSEF